MFERIDYEVKRIDGDYAYLQNMENGDESSRLQSGSRIKMQRKKF